MTTSSVTAPSALQWRPAVPVIDDALPTAGDGSIVPRVVVEQMLKAQAAAHAAEMAMVMNSLKEHSIMAITGSERDEHDHTRVMAGMDGLLTALQTSDARNATLAAKVTELQALLGDHEKLSESRLMLATESYEGQIALAKMTSAGGSHGEISEIYGRSLHSIRQTYASSMRDTKIFYERRIALLEGREPLTASSPHIGSLDDMVTAVQNTLQSMADKIKDAEAEAEKARSNFEQAMHVAAFFGEKTKELQLALEEEKDSSKIKILEMKIELHDILYRQLELEKALQAEKVNTSVKVFETKLADRAILDRKIAEDAKTLLYARTVHGTNLMELLKAREELKRKDELIEEQKGKIAGLELIMRACVYN